MRFKFDANQEYQLTAIQAVADLFDGQVAWGPQITFQLGQQSSLAAVPNRLDLDEPALLSNLGAVQSRNRIAPDTDLCCIEATIDTASGSKAVRFPNFSVE